MTFDDRVYFEQRATEERVRAKSAASPAVARIHIKLAEKYEFLVLKARESSVVRFEQIDSQRNHSATR